jgi:hypothetical protein
MFWTIVLIGINISGTAYVGQFEQEAQCQKAAQDARQQSIRAVCVQTTKSTTEVAKK